MLDFPGREFAEDHGYTLKSYSSTPQDTVKSATYCNGHGLFLTVYSDGLAELVKYIGLISVSTRTFSFPHPRFEEFENEINSVVRLE